MGSKWRLEIDEDSSTELKTWQVTRSTVFFTLDLKEIIIILNSNEYLSVPLFKGAQGTYIQMIFTTMNRNII